MSDTNFIWALAEITDGKINPVSYETIARGVALKDKITNPKVISILVGESLDEKEVKTLIHHGADEVYYIRDERLKPFLVQNYSSALEDLVNAKKPLIFLAAATTYGRTIMPYLAIRVQGGLTADCTELDIEEGTDNLLQTRPAIGGNILATIKTPNHRPQMATVRPHSTPLLEADTSRQGTIVEIQPEDKHFISKVKFVSHEAAGAGDEGVADAVKVVSLGRGIQSPDNISVVTELAQALDSKVGASRSAVDQEWVTYPHQVGLTGKTVSPDMYFAVGISGAVQHLAGMQTSKHIIAINKDADAQIFQVANVGIVGDALKVLPVVLDKVKKKKGLS